MLESAGNVNMMLTPGAQREFCALNEHIYPVPNKWGDKGWTTFELANLDKVTVEQALTSAYQDVIVAKPKRKR